MKIKYCRNIMQPVDGMQKIAAIAWSANSKKFAIATADRVSLSSHFHIQIQILDRPSLRRNSREARQVLHQVRKIRQ